MKRIMLLTLIAISLIAVRAEAQSGSVRIATAQASPAVSPTSRRSEQETLIPAQPGTEARPNISSTGNQRPAFIGVFDISRSVKRHMRQMRSVAEQAYNAAPEDALPGVVAVGWQAEKKLFSQRTEAIAFVNSLKATSGYTDLGRGTDSALALLQEARSDRALIMYLTDGKVSLPDSYQDKSDFATILRREFTQRPNVRVIIINVSSEPMGGIDSLPSNVTVYTLASWSEAEAAMQKSLSAEIKEQFAVPVPSATPASNPSTSTVPTASASKRVFVGAGLLLIVLAAIAFFVQRKWRKKTSNDNNDSDIPANILRAADIKPPEPEIAPEPVVILEFKGDNVTPGGAVMKRAVVRVDESLIIGNSPFDADIAFKHLKQQQCVELRFDGEKLKGFRLRPNTIGVVDSVRLNDEDAPFTFTMSEEDELTIGDLKAHLLFTDDSYLESLGIGSQETISVTTPTRVDGEIGLGGERRLRRGVSKMSTPSA